MKFLERLQLHFDNEDGNGDGGGTADDGAPKTPEGDGGADDGPSGDGGAQSDSGDDSPADPSGSALTDALERERAERKRMEQELQKLKQKEKEREEAELSELEKAQKRAEELEQKYQQREQEMANLTKQNALRDAAAKHGLLNPGRTLRMVDDGEVVIGEDGNVHGAEKAVLDLREEMPQLFGEGGPKTPANTGGGGGDDGSGSDDTKSGGSGDDRSKGANAMKKFKNRGRNSVL